MRIVGGIGYVVYQCNEASVEENVARTTTIVSAVRQAMVQLNEIDKLLIELRYAREHRTFKEIGQLLAMKEGTVRQRHSRALQQLKGILNQDGRITALLRDIKSEEKKEA